MDPSIYFSFHLFGGNKKWHGNFATLYSFEFLAFLPSCWCDLWIYCYIIVQSDSEWTNYKFAFSNYRR